MKAKLLYLYPDSRNRANGHWNSREAILTKVADVARINLDNASEAAIRVAVAKAEVVLFEAPATGIVKTLRDLHEDNDDVHFVEVTDNPHNLHEIAKQVDQYNRRPRPVVPVEPTPTEAPPLAPAPVSAPEGGEKPTEKSIPEAPGEVKPPEPQDSEVK